MRRRRGHLRKREKDNKGRFVSNKKEYIMEEKSSKTEESVVLDGRAVTQEELNREKEKVDQRIVEDGEAGKFKTLKRLRD
jgi:hypothetical protein